MLLRRWAAPNDTVDTNEDADDAPPITEDTSEPTEDDTDEDDTGPIDDTASNSAYRVTQSISYNGVEVDVIIDKPEGDSFDTLVVYHGTVWYDDQVLASAEISLDKFIEILDRTDMMVISVAYPEENLLMGENIIYAEAALLWVQNQAATDLGIDINRVFLGVTRKGATSSRSSIPFIAPTVWSQTVQDRLTCTIAVSSKRTMKSNPAISASSSTKPSAAPRKPRRLSRALFNQLYHRSHLPFAGDTRHARCRSSAGQLATLQAKTK